MEILKKSIAGHETVLFGEDQAAGYRGIIAIHNTTLGPALGGTRLCNYANDAEGLTDVLRLSRGMNYKNALAGLPPGAGKSIIFAPDEILDREKLFRAHGRFIERLGGSYITAPRPRALTPPPQRMLYVIMKWCDLSTYLQAGSVWLR